MTRYATPNFWIDPSAARRCTPSKSALIYRRNSNYVLRAAALMFICSVSASKMADACGSFQGWLLIEHSPAWQMALHFLFLLFIAAFRFN